MTTSSRQNPPISTLFQYLISSDNENFGLAVVGAAMVLWVMFGSFNRALEIAGFAALVAATVWDWRAKKSRRDG
jgi:hypothetical protein